MTNNLVYLSAYCDYEMWKAKYPDKIICSDRYVRRGLLLRSDGHAVDITEDYMLEMQRERKERARIEKIAEYTEEMLADGTGD